MCCASLIRELPPMAMTMVFTRVRCQGEQALRVPRYPIHGGKLKLRDRVRRGWAAAGVSEPRTGLFHFGTRGQVLTQNPRHMRGGAREYRPVAGFQGHRTFV